MSLALSPRGRVREAIEDIIDMPDLHAITIPSIVDQVVRAIKADEAWNHDMLSESVTPIVRELTSQVLSHRRRLGLKAPVLVGSSVLSARAVDEFVTKKASVFETWLEHCGDKHVKLLDMTREHLHTARVIRITSAVTDLHVARLFQVLEEGLESDEQTVGERYTTEDIARLAATTSIPVTDDTAVLDVFASLAETIAVGLPAATQEED